MRNCGQLETPCALAFGPRPATPTYLAFPYGAKTLASLAFECGAEARDTSAFLCWTETPRAVALLKGSNREILLHRVHFVTKFVQRVRIVISSVPHDTAAQLRFVSLYRRRIAIGRRAEFNHISCNEIVGILPNVNQIV